MAIPHRQASEEQRKIQMTADRLLVEVQTEEGERKSRGGILIPATADVSRRLEWGEVVITGPTVRSIEVGDSVLFAPDSAYEVEIRGDLYVILREPDVQAVAASAPEDSPGLYL
ncbi:MAG: co-chaperone GroES [Actinobacteria bacterium ATB1]|nr:co-chaperone GroES [Actinobacteria bacterium ATB1]